MSAWNEARDDVIGEGLDDRGWERASMAKDSRRQLLYQRDNCTVRHSNAGR